MTCNRRADLCRSCRTSAGRSSTATALIPRIERARAAAGEDEPSQLWILISEPRCWKALEVASLAIKPMVTTDMAVLVAVSFKISLKPFSNPAKLQFFQVVALATLAAVAAAMPEATQ